MADYSHELIASSRHYQAERKELGKKADKPGAPNWDTFCFPTEDIEAAIKFDLGEYSQVHELVGNKEEVVFHELPAEICLFSVFLDWTKLFPSKTAYEELRKEHSGTIDFSYAVLAKKLGEHIYLTSYVKLDGGSKEHRWAQDANMFRIDSQGNLRVVDQLDTELGLKPGDANDVTLAIYRSIEIFSCSNIKQVVHSPPKFINRKRIAKKKVPFFEYRTIVIDVNDDNPRHATISADSDEAKTLRRLHLCRGHIRRYKSGKRVWVQAHMRGTKTQGLIQHGYKVKYK